MHVLLHDASAVSYIHSLALLGVNTHIHAVVKKYAFILFCVRRGQDLPLAMFSVHEIPILRFVNEDTSNANHNHKKCSCSVALCKKI